MFTHANQSSEYCIYLRKSRVDRDAEADGQGDTLERHRRQLLELARKMGLAITSIYEEVVSGETIAARPEVQRLLRDVESGRWKGVLCMEVERLARGNTTDQGIVADTFKYSNTKIITPMKTYDPSDEYDEEYFEFGLFMSRREYKTINRRLQRGRMASLSEGKFIAGAAPYGYEKYKLSKQKGYSLRIVPAKAEIIRQIFQWYVHGEPDGTGASSPMGASIIAKKLNGLGIPSPSGGLWPACTVRDIITNPTYAGKIRWSYRPTVKLMRDGKRVETRPVNHGNEWVDGIHEAIIDSDTWDKAQKILAGRSHPPVPKSYQISNPLAGLVYCYKCGRSMVRLPGAPKKNTRPSLRCPNPDCDCVGSPLDDVEAAVMAALSSWLDAYKVKLARMDGGQSISANSLEGEITQLKKVMDTSQKQLNSLYDLVEQGIYTKELFLSRSQVLNAKITETGHLLSAAQTRLASSRQIQVNRSEFIPRLEYVLNSYSSLESAREKNDLLKNVLDHVIYQKTIGGYRRKSDLRVFVFPKVEPLE